MICSPIVEAEIGNTNSTTDIIEPDVTNSAVLLTWQRFPKSLTAQLTVFCDLDGPLIDVSERYYQTYLQALQATAPNSSAFPLSKAEFWALKQERTADVEIAQRSGLTPEQIPEFLQRVVALVNQPQQLSQDQLQPGVKWSLALLHDAGVRLVLVTLRPQAEAEQLLQHYELRGYFQAVWGTTDADAAYHNHVEHKQHLLEMATQQSQINDHSRVASCESTVPSSHARYWMIGDTEADVLAGQALNVSTIALTCGIRSQGYLEPLQPTRIDRDLLMASHYLLGLSGNLSSSFKEVS